MSGKGAMRGHLLDNRSQAILDNYMTNLGLKQLKGEQRLRYEEILATYGEQSAWRYKVTTLNDAELIRLRPTTRTPDGVMLWVFPNPLKMFTVVAYNFEDADEARWMLENCYDIKTEDDFMFERPTFNCERFDVETLDSRFHFAPPLIPIMPK